MREQHVGPRLLTGVRLEPTSTPSRIPHTRSSGPSPGYQRDAAGAQPHREGQALPGEVANHFGARFGFDFSGVRTYADSEAAQIAHSLGARAFTIGRDVVFARGEYSPYTVRGQRLLAHELAHVVQQDGSTAVAQPKVAVGQPSSSSEQAADDAVRAVLHPEFPRGHSPALAVRDALRSTKPAPNTLQRAVATWGGEFDTDSYTTKKNVGGIEVGAAITIRFKPGPAVDAKKIGMVQIARSMDAGAPFYIDPTVKAHSIQKGAGAGFHIDQLTKFANPLYATGATAAKDTLASTATDKQWGRHGWRYMDATGKEQKRDALLIDSATLGVPNPDSSQTFESTAVALEGAQRGTYYGSVRWGWRTNATGKFSRVPFAKVSDNVPTGTFAGAASLWNTGTTSTGAATINLPLATPRYVNSVDVELVSDPTKAAGSVIGKLAKNTTVQVTDKGSAQAFNKTAAAGAHWWKLTVFEGVLVGRVGWILESRLAAKKS